MNRVLVLCANGYGGSNAYAGSDGKIKINQIVEFVPCYWIRTEQIARNEWTIEWIKSAKQKETKRAENNEKKIEVKTKRAKTCIESPSIACSTHKHSFLSFVSFSICYDWFFSPRLFVSEPINWNCEIIYEDKVQIDSIEIKWLCQQLTEYNNI